MFDPGPGDTIDVQDLSLMDVFHRGRGYQMSSRLRAIASCCRSEVGRVVRCGLGQDPPAWPIEKTRGASPMTNAIQVHTWSL